MNVDDLPLMLTVEEAAQVCRISRSAAYELARLYERTDGADGMPVVRLGRRLRVPKTALVDRMLDPKRS